MMLALNMLEAFLPSQSLEFSRNPVNELKGRRENALTDVVNIIIKLQTVHSSSGNWA